MSNKQLGQRIAELRKQNNLSQKELAEKLCVSNKTISKWECGNGSPDFETMQKLANIFSISLDDFSKSEKQTIKQEENKQIKQENVDNNINKKKVTIISSIISACIVLVLTISLLCFFLVPRNPNIQESSLFTINQEQSELYCSVDNNKEILSLGNSLELPRNNKWKLYYDVNGMVEISSKTVNLQVGDNVFYIVVENTAGETKTYKTIIRRKPLYVVTFNANGGDLITQQIVMEDNFAELVIPNREGYIFNCWDYDFSKPITSNITINASWIAKNLKITYFANNGTDNSVIQNITYDTQVSLKSENEFTKKGYTLSSWNTKSDGSGNSFSTSKSYTNYNIAEDLILYAQWVINQYDINATKNLENAGTINGLGSFDYNSTKTLTAITNEGYTWDGWYSVDGTSLSKSQSLQLTLEDKDIEVCARWTANKYNINLNVNGGNSISLERKKLTFGESFTLPITMKTEAIFLGWFDDKNTQYTNANGTSLINWDIAFNTTLYAHYKINEYQVDLSKNIGVAGSVSGNGLKEYGSTVNLSAQTNDGYSFVGWYLGTEQISTNTTYSFVMSNYPIVYTAKWKANDYTITMNVNDGIGLVENTQIITFNTTFTLPTTTKNGYTFDGWYLGVNGTGTQITDNNGNSLTVWNIADNKTLYAKWDLITNAITYSLNDGTVATANPTTYTIEDLDITINNPTRAGYVFDGWIGTNLEEPTKTLKISAGSFGDRHFGACWSKNNEFVAISNATDLCNIVNNLNGYYYLTQDIDMTGIEFTTLGDENNAFTGVLDGCGHIITNLNTENGIFYNLTGQVFNLGIYSTTKIYCPIANYNNGKIQNCKIEGILKSYGITKTNNGQIINCTVKGKITDNQTAVVNANACGVCYTNNNLIYGCIINATITASSNYKNAVAAGISAINCGLIQNSIVLNDVTASAGRPIDYSSMTGTSGCVGRIVSNNATNGQLVNVYYLSSQKISATEFNSSSQKVSGDYNRTGNSIVSFNVSNIGLGIFVDINNLVLCPNNVWVEVDGDYPKLYWEI